MEIADISDSESVDNSNNDQNQVIESEIKPFWLATCVSSPLGCIATIIFTIFYLGIFGYLLLNPLSLCLSFNFTDFEVIGSEVSENFYKKTLSNKDSFKKQYVDSRRRLLTLDADEYDNGYQSRDYFSRKDADIYLEVFYFSKYTDDILTNDLLTEAHDIEQGIKEYKGYHDHSILYSCYDGSEPISCSSTVYLEVMPISLINYIYPQRYGDYFIYTGDGDEICCSDVKYFLRKNIENHNIPTDFFDFKFSQIDVISRYIISIYPFSFKNKWESDDELNDFVISYRDYFMNLNIKNVDIAYSDNKGKILNAELFYYVYNDLNLAILSLLVVFIVLYIFVRSFFLTIFGLFGVVSAFIPCLYIYNALFGESFNIINLVSIWIILGIGCDDICVFISSYRRAPLQTKNGKFISNSLRMAFAYREGGGAMFISSTTTAFSFFSLCFSKIAPIPQFGTFCGMLVIFNFILVMTWFPVVLQTYILLNQYCLLDCDCYFKLCNKCLSVPIPLIYNQNEEEEEEEKEEQMNDDNNLIGDRISTQISDKFVIPSEPSKSKYIKKIINILDPKYNIANIKDDRFTDCTNLYFIIMKKYYVGLLLLLIVTILTCYFGYAATMLQFSKEAQYILPDWTNWGKVKTSLSNIGVDRKLLEGINTDSNSLNFAVYGTTPDPTNSPTLYTYTEPSIAPTIKTLKPSYSPTQRLNISSTISSTIVTTHMSPTPISNDNNDTNGWVKSLDRDESITVYILFGVKSATGYSQDCAGAYKSGTITYDTHFNIYKPESQLRFLELCDELYELGLRDNTMYRLDNAQKPCFFELFAQYVNDSGHVFPINNDKTLFNGLMKSFLFEYDNTIDGTWFSQWIGFNDHNGNDDDFHWNTERAEVLWIAQRAETQMDVKWGTNKLQKYYNKWQLFMNDFNSKSPTEFNDGIQTAAMWIRMDVEMAFLDGFTKSIGFTILVCGIIMIFFTQNFVLVIIVCIYILIIVIWVIGLFSALEWPFGIVEIISIPTIVGLSIDYALHISHSYLHSSKYGINDKINRSKSSINNLGSSVCASAITTILSMLIMYFATIVVFTDLGLIVGFTITFGLCLAIFILPPLLMYIGPQNNTCHVLWCYKEILCCNLCKTYKNYNFNFKNNSNISITNSTITSVSNNDIELTTKDSKNNKNNKNKNKNKNKYNLISDNGNITQNQIKDIEATESKNTKKDKENDDKDTAILYANINDENHP